MTQPQASTKDETRCEQCSGSGLVDAPYQIMTGEASVTIPHQDVCPSCGGRGRVSTPDASLLREVESAETREAAAIALAWHARTNGSLSKEYWPDTYNESAKQSARNRANAVLDAVLVRARKEGAT